ncbi:MAG: hypothetical protein ACERKZ_02405 [Lachnotalea sp.]
MDKNEFSKKAKQYGYSDEQIQEFIDLTEEARKDGAPVKYEDIVLIEQPVY